MKVNLLKERNQAYSINWMEIVIIITVALFIMGVGIHYYYLYTDSMLLKADVDNLYNQETKLRIEVIKFNKLQDKVEELTRIKEKMDTLKYLWDGAIIEQGYIIPNKVMLGTLSLEENTLKLLGRADTNQKVLDYISNMKLSPFYGKVTIKDLQTQANDAIFTLETVIVEEGDL